MSSKRALRFIRFFFATAVSATALPNIVVFLTDDQDQMLGGAFPTTSLVGDACPMPKTKELMVTGGAMFSNAFVHTPICSPSRSELLTGKLFHNLKTTDTGLWAMHIDEDQVHNNTFAQRLKDGAGYKTGLFGKYLNVMPSFTPSSWDAWLANGGGDYIAPSFATSGLADYGFPEGTGQADSSPANYTTAVVGNASIAWLRAELAAGNHVLAYIAPKAAHEPFLPAPWYADYWDESWPNHEPRPPPFNASAEARQNHSGVVADQPLLSEEAAAVITGAFKNRWRTIMSVDDVIAAVIGAVDEVGQGDNTYFFFTSDHGFQLGEFNFIMDKRHAYDWVTRIPLLAMGPGIRPSTVIEAPVMMTDLAPTMIHIAGLDPKDWGDLPSPDGSSFLPLLTGAGDKIAASEPWRDTVFMEYYFVDDNVKCVKNCTEDGLYPSAEANCADLSTSPNGACWGTETVNGVKPAASQGCDMDCYPTEDIRNNFIALRRPLEGLLYVEYETGNQTAGDLAFEVPDFYELFNATADPWLMTNIYDATVASNPDLIASLHSELHVWFECSEVACP